MDASRESDPCPQGEWQVPKPADLILESPTLPIGVPPMSNPPIFRKDPLDRLQVASLQKSVDEINATKKGTNPKDLKS